MSEEDTRAPTAKQPGRFRRAIIAATSAVGLLTGLVVALNGFFEPFGELVAKVQWTSAGLGRQAPTDPSSPPSASAPQHGTQPPPPQQEAVPSRGPVVERTAGPLFVAAPPGSDGALIGTRARKVLEQEGFTLAGDRGAASIAIEIAPPVFGPARTLPSSGLAITSVAATLQAKMTSNAGGAPAAPPQEREVVGRGDGEEAARRDAIARAADQIGERIVAALRQSTASNAPKP